MAQQAIETHLVKKQATSSAVCAYCKETMYPEETIYLEEGVEQHLHSLLARKFCSHCYAKYGERILIKGNSK